MANKYLDYAGLQHLVDNIDKKYAPIAAVLFKGSVASIEDLPALTDQKVGWMYNVEVGGGTTSDFIEGPGHILGDGENVAVVELITGYAEVASPAVTDDPKKLGWYEATTTVTYEQVTPVGDEDPKALGWYEFVDPDYVLTEDETVTVGKDYFEQVTTTEYHLSEDRIADLTKTYYTSVNVKKWDILGGVFDLEGRYLEFGAQFPKNPVDGRTFLYMGPATKIYTAVATPSGRPVDKGYFEGTFTAISDPEEIAAIVNPKQEGLYEEDAVTTGLYVHSADITPNASKTYYRGVFAASADTTVDPSKIYYTEADQYKTAVIYVYDATTTQDWVAQTSGDDYIPITNAEIDELFI